MKKKFEFCITIFILIFIGSCESRTNFYNRRAGFDYNRIPFVKPYEALQLNGTKSWIMNLYNSAYNSSVFNIKDARVINDAILLHSKNTYLDGTRAKEAWFVIIPYKHIEIGFSSHHDYISYLKSNMGVNKEPKLFKIEAIDSYFDRHFPIDWNHFK